jgi:tRNA(fMet)-specific endonuclease VapC
MGAVAERPVLDSDVLIDYLRGAGPGRDLLARLAPNAGYVVTAVSAFELALGRSFEHQSAGIGAVLAVPCLPLTRAAGLRAAALVRSLRQRERTIEFRDAMQAGICLEAGATLVTRNLKHFGMVDGLAVEHPERWIGRLD